MPIRHKLHDQCKQQFQKSITIRTTRPLINMITRLSLAWPDRTKRKISGLATRDYTRLRPKSFIKAPTFLNTCLGIARSIIIMLANLAYCHEIFLRKPRLHTNDFSGSMRYAPFNVYSYMINHKATPFYKCT